MISKVGLGEELFERYRCSVTELAEQVRNHLGEVALPDLNLDNLKALLARGWTVKEIQLEPFGGPIAGNIGVRFLLERNGLQVVVPVSPGEGLAEFLLKKAKEWEQKGVLAHYIIQSR
ncbi:hypothetical protein Q2T83_10990 [Fervidibacter sacchari]|uniref:Uncharacterized protein n=1 Tax=Candidatus Fervidibacter sacchari TaxID=1448929 RepID=A0ABT2ESH8_9BACT|nr:hypothetical protein [Candidatus Fervidibacter sacchari]MCS3920911.1 hypothetical protein [Candidatus Fervidibacter sacchari]WKU14861.1 hypothetical protein Q2T83_10990 [Candidatus Fervidibacter sacchari]